MKDSLVSATNEIQNCVGQDFFLTIEGVKVKIGNWSKKEVATLENNMKAYLQVSLYYKL